MEGRKEVAVVLTERGRHVLESHRHDRDRDHKQEFYADLKKPREMEHDAQIYSAYLREAERLEERGARIERVILDYELKRDYQQWLHERDNGDGRPNRDEDEIRDWAYQHDLPYFDEQVHFPDLRIEYRDVEGRYDHDDVEVMTVHYRGGRAAAAARSGFRCHGGFERPDGRPFIRSGSGRGVRLMRFEERVRAVAEFGFTERQARFLVTVMLHSGVCMIRQYATFAGIVEGQKTRKFFAKLVRLRYASAYRCRHNRGRVYQVRHKALYRAIGQTDSRHRRPLSPARVVERLMLLDALVADRDFVWLATDEDKTTHLGALASFPDGALAAAGLGTSASRFSEKFPIGIDLKGCVVLLYLGANDDIRPFRLFVQRHFELLRSLPAWTLRIVVPPKPHGLDEPYLKIAHEELTNPVDPRILRDLRWYFSERRKLGAKGYETPDQEEFDYAEEAFKTARFELLYRRWLTDGDRVFDLVSTGLKDAVERDAGRIESVVLLRDFRLVSPLVGSTVRRLRGAEKGEETLAAPRPPASVSPIDSSRVSARV